MAARMMHNAELKGKRVTKAATGRKNEISAGNVAYYTIVKLRNGCRSHGLVTGDVYGSGTQINGRTHLNSLDEVVAKDDVMGEIQLHDVLADEQDDPGTRATRKMDWETFMAGLSERERVAIEYIVEGKTLREAGQVLKVSDSSMQTSKQSLKNKIIEFMGLDILASIQRRPQWKQNLDSIRESLAVRYERCYA